MGKLEKVITDKLFENPIIFPNPFINYVIILLFLKNLL